MSSVFRFKDRWRFKVRELDGHWKTYTTTATTKTEAKALALARERVIERQRLGLEPVPQDCRLTLAEACRWWLEKRCKPASLKRERDRLNRYVIGCAVGELPLPRVTTAVLEDWLRELEHGGLGAASINHLRSKLHTVFSRARKAGLWTGANPVDEVERREVARRPPSPLTDEEALLVLPKVPARWRPIVATAIWTAMRKGEIFGLRKEDVNLRDRIITVAHSYDRPTTKGGHVDSLPIAEALVPYLEQAMRESKGDLVFPDPATGGMRRQDSKPEVVLRRAMRAARLVEAWDHVCRWCKHDGKPEHTWRYQDDGLRRCPTCDKKLFPKAVPRKTRFHDLRHTAATLMLREKVDVHRVQRVLRHRDVKTTTTTYAHLLVDDLRSAVGVIAPNAAPPAPESAPLGIPLVSGSGRGTQAPIGASEKRPGFSAEGKRARRESNPRPTASKADRADSGGSTNAHGPCVLGTLALAGDGPVSCLSTPQPEILGIPLVSAPARPSAGGPTAPLLSASQVAERLGVCRETVYRLADRGELPCVRIASLLRFEPEALEAFVARGGRP